MQNTHPMQNYPNGFEYFPIAKMTWRQFFRHLFTAIENMTWNWSQNHYLGIDLTSAWWIAGHAFSMLDEYKSNLDEYESSPEVLNFD